MTLHTQLSLMLWIMKMTPHKLSMVTKASLRQDGAKPGPSGVFHLQEGVASLVLSPLQGAKVLEEVTCPPEHLATWGASLD